jgi:hypothetical protein
VPNPTAPAALLGFFEVRFARRVPGGLVGQEAQFAASTQVKRLAPLLGFFEVAVLENTPGGIGRSGGSFRGREHTGSRRARRGLVTDQSVTPEQLPGNSLFTVSSHPPYRTGHRSRSEEHAGSGLFVLTKLAGPL